jgi:ankyrin repeat protein
MRDDFNDTVGRKSVQPAGPLEKELLAACEKGETVKVADLIKQGANVFVNSEKPLLLAAENGHLEVVKLLVAEGSLGIMRYTAPTIKAAANGHQEVANYLRQALAARNLRKNDSFKP